MATRRRTVKIPLVRAMRPRFPHKRRREAPSEALQRMSYAEYAPETGTSAKGGKCYFCELTEPGEACPRCGIPTPLPTVKGL